MSNVGKIDFPENIRKGVRPIDIKSLVPYKQHCFTLYSGERLDDMVRSIQNNGVIVPIIVRNIPNSDKFEILSGHNRVYAAGMAGKKNVPAIIKENLTDEESAVYVIETNLIQRGFKDLKISEQAFAIALRYRKLFDSKKIKAITDELQALESGVPLGHGCSTDKNGVPVGHQNKSRVRDITAEEYGIGQTTVARLLRINELTDNLKRMVDEGKIKIRPAVELSFLSKELQEEIYTIIKKNGVEIVDMKMAKQFRDLSEDYANPSRELLKAVLLGKQNEQPDKEKTYKVTVSHAAYTKYFVDVPKKEINKIIEKALEMYFESVKNAV